MGIWAWKQEFRFSSNLCGRADSQSQVLLNDAVESWTITYRGVFGLIPQNLRKRSAGIP